MTALRAPAADLTRAESLELSVRDYHAELKARGDCPVCNREAAPTRMPIAPKETP